jgi:hypothetical protein
MEINYKDYENTIKMVALKYHKLSGVDYYELISAGNEKFLKYQEKWNPSKSCFKTFLIMKLNSYYKCEMRKRKNFIFYQDPLNIYPNNNGSFDTENKCIFVDSLNKLSNDIKYIIKVIFDSPPDLIDMIPKKQPRGITQAVLRQYLYKNGWKYLDINDAFKTLKTIWN